MTLLTLDTNDRMLPISCFIITASLFADACKYTIYAALGKFDLQ